jgi:hypothetical protein
MARQASPTRRRACVHRRAADADSTAVQIRRNCLAAFDEIKTGLSDYLPAHPEVAGGRPRRGGRRGTSTPSSHRGLSDAGLAREATVRLLRLLFLLFADGRGLRSAVSGDSVFGAEFAGALRGLDTYADMDIRVLGDVYEAILERTARESTSGRQGPSTRAVSLRKSTGRYYTPESVVDYVVRKALGKKLRGLSSNEILGLRVLDPAMGSGHFLLRAAGYLAAAYGRALTREANAEHGTRVDKREMDRYRNLVVRRCIYGVDTDPVAVEVARVSLWLLAGGGKKTLQILSGHLRCGDALLGAVFDDDVSEWSVEPAEWNGGSPGWSIALAERGGGRPDWNTANRLHPFHWALEFPEAARGRKRNGGPGFDIVIGNPPYVSFSGRQKAGPADYPSESGRKQTRPKGWPSAHGLFMLRAAKLINDDGIISFIMPGQVGHLRGYGPVRAELIRTCDLLEVRYWGEDVFRDVTTPALTFIARGRGSHRRCKCLLKRQDGGTDRFGPEGESTWFVSPYRHILDRMTGLHPTIETFGDPGVHTGNAAARLLLSSRRPRWVPIVEGKQVHPFYCEPPRRWLNLRYQPSEGEYFRISGAAVYRDTDILIRQTAARPIAARHSRRCHFRNSVLVLKAPEGFSVEYLLGILNSDAADILYRAVAPESSQRTFPQIKVHALRRLPIPDPRLGRNRRAVARIERTVKSIEARTQEGRPAGRLLRSLNLMVHDLYGLPDTGE